MKLYLRTLLMLNWRLHSIKSCQRSLIYCGSSSMGKRPLLKPISVVGSGLEATMSDPDKNLISIKNIEIVVESEDDDKMKVRVDLPGKETQIVFEKILINLACSAPHVPGLRREKGGFLKTISLLVAFPPHWG